MDPDPGGLKTSKLFSHLNLAKDSLLVFVFSFKEFNDASKKNRKLALKEIFAKMLLRLKVRRVFLKPKL
jgi:hypothetical protein